MKEERWNLQWHAKFQLSHAQKGKVDGHFASLVGMQICAASVEGKLVVVLMHLPLTQGFSFNLQMHVNMHCKIRVIARDWGALHFHGRPGASSRVHRTRKQEDTSLSSTRAGSVLGSGVGGGSSCSPPTSAIRSCRSGASIPHAGCCTLAYMAHLPRAGFWMLLLPLFLDPSPSNQDCHWLQCSEAEAVPVTALHLRRQVHWAFCSVPCHAVFKFPQHALSCSLVLTLLVRDFPRFWQPRKKRSIFILKAFP